MLWKDFYNFIEEAKQDSKIEVITLTASEVATLDRIGAEGNKTGKADDFLSYLCDLAISKYDTATVNIYNAWNIA